MKTVMQMWSILPVVASLVLPGHAQTTWNVGICPGPGIHFMDLPPAVAAAAPGDTIRIVSEGTCVGRYLTAVHIDKPLTIIGGVGSLGGLGPIRGQVTISGIAHGSRVVLSNLLISAALPLWPALPTPSGIHAWDCAGEILLEDVGYTSFGLANSRLRFERCARVVMHGCELYPAEEPLVFEDSAALLSWTTVFMRGAAATPWNYPPHSAAVSREGLLLRNSDVWMCSSVIYGGPVIAWLSNWTGPSPGAVIESGTLTLGPEARLRGGFDGYTICSVQYPGFACGYRIPQGATGRVVQDPRSLHTGVEPGSQPPQMVDVSTVFHPRLRQGAQYPLVVYGPLGGFALLAAGSSLETPAPTGFGDLWIDPLALLTIGIVPLSTDRGHALLPSLQCSPFLPVGHVFAFQAALLSPSGGLSTSLPSPFTVAWQLGRVP